MFSQELNQTTIKRKEKEKQNFFFWCFSLSFRSSEVLFFFCSVLVRWNLRRLVLFCFSFVVGVFRCLFFDSNV